MPESFDEYVSLGSDCEVGFQFRRVLGHDSSSFCNWNVTGIAALERLLATRFAEVLQEQNIAPMPTSHPRSSAARTSWKGTRLSGTNSGLPTS